MATDRLINQAQGEDIIDKLNDIASNVGNITYGPQTSSDKVVSMTGYQEASVVESISQGDTLNEAIGKLEKKADTNATSIADRVISPATNTDETIPVFNGQNSKTVKDSGVKIVTTADTTKDDEVPTSKAINTVITNKGYAVGVQSSTENGIVLFNSTDGKTLKNSSKTINNTLAGTPTDNVILTEKAIADNYVRGASSASDGAIAVFDQSTGKKVKNSSTTISTAFDATPSSSHVPTESAVATYLTSKISTTVPPSPDNTTVPGMQLVANTYVPKSDLVEVVNNGAKNEFQYDAVGTDANHSNSFTMNKVTYTIQSDYSIKITTDGAATGNAYMFFYFDNVQCNIKELFDGNHILSGTSSGASTSTHRFFYAIDDNPTVSVSEPTVLPNASSATKVVLGIQVQASQNYGSTGIVYKPMICTESQYNISSEYEPYALGNQILTPAMIQKVDEGAKNLFNIPAMTTTISNQITFTPNADGTVVATGTASGGNGQYRLGTYAANTLNGLVIDGVTVDNDNTYIRIQRNASPWDGYNIFFANNGYIIPTINYEANIYLVISSGTALPTRGITFFPMLCTQTDWNVSHKRVPYRPNWSLVSNSVDYTTRMNVTGTSTVSNANLNNISVSEERVYNNPTNLPSGTSGFVICKTIIVDNITGYQEITFISNQGSTIHGDDYPTFVRTKTSSIWRAWMKIDNQSRYILDTGSVDTSSKTVDITALPVGTYLLAVRNSLSQSQRYASSLYMFTRHPDYTAVGFTAIKETTGSTVTNFTISDGTLSMTYDSTGYHATNARRI